MCVSDRARLLPLVGLVVVGFGCGVGRVDLALERVVERVRSVVVDRGELGISFALFVGHDLGEVGVDARGVELLDGVDLAEECGAEAQQGPVLTFAATGDS